MDGREDTRGWAIFIARAILGWIFFMAGLWKVFDLGPVEHARRYFISRGLVGEPVAIRPTQEDGQWQVVYCHRQIATIDVHDPDEV